MPTVEERLASLETKVDAIADLRAEMRTMFSELRADLNHLRADMNQRFDQVDRRFEGIDRRIDALDQKVDRHFMWLVSTQAAMVATMVGWLVTIWLR